MCANYNIGRAAFHLPSCQHTPWKDLVSRNNLGLPSRGMGRAGVGVSCEATFLRVVIPMHEGPLRVSEPAVPVVSAVSAVISTEAEKSLALRQPSTSPQRPSYRRLPRGKYEGSLRRRDPTPSALDEGGGRARPWSMTPNDPHSLRGLGEST